MTPMIDVVFLLIIFFLVSSHLAKREARLPLDLPAASSSDFNETANRLTINIDEDGGIQMGGVPVSRNRVGELLLRHEQQHRGTAAVRIRTDRAVAYGVIEPLLRELVGIGIVDITFAVRREK